MRFTQAESNTFWWLMPKNWFALYAQIYIMMLWKSDHFTQYSRECVCVPNIYDDDQLCIRECGKIDYKNWWKQKQWGKRTKKNEFWQSKRMKKRTNKRKSETNEWKRADYSYRYICMARGVCAHSNMWASFWARTVDSVGSIDIRKKNHNKLNNNKKL